MASKPEASRTPRCRCDRDTMAEPMRRLGHASPGAVLRYQHAADDRDQAIAAAALSEFAGAKIIQLRPKRKADPV